MAVQKATRRKSSEENENDYLHGGKRGQKKREGQKIARLVPS